MVDRTDWKLNLYGPLDMDLFMQTDHPCPSTLGGSQICIFWKQIPGLDSNEVLCQSSNYHATSILVQSSSLEGTTVVSSTP